LSILPVVVVVVAVGELRILLGYLLLGLVLEHRIASWSIEAQRQLTSQRMPKP
jgi:hypothetical protein